MARKDGYTVAFLNGDRNELGIEVVAGLEKQVAVVGGGARCGGIDHMRRIYHDAVCATGAGAIELLEEHN